VTEIYKNNAHCKTSLPVLVPTGPEQILFLEGFFF
jgi:hypothetical protein